MLTAGPYPEKREPHYTRLAPPTESDLSDRLLDALEATVDFVGSDAPAVDDELTGRVEVRRDVGVEGRSGGTGRVALWCPRVMTVAGGM